MKFESKLAQAAYDEIKNRHDEIEDEMDAKTSVLWKLLTPYEQVKMAESNSRKTVENIIHAIEVAAKIEIEEKRLILAAIGLRQ